MSISILVFWSGLRAEKSIESAGKSIAIASSARM